MFVPISKLIPKALTKFGFSKQAKAAFICEKFRKIAAENIPAKILMNTWPKNYQNGILTIFVTHPILAQELMERKHGLIKKMNETIMKEWPGQKKQAIKDIKTQVSEPKETLDFGA